MPIKQSGCTIERKFEIVEIDSFGSSRKIRMVKLGNNKMMEAKEKGQCERNWPCYGHGEEWEVVEAKEFFESRDRESRELTRR